MEAEAARRVAQAQAAATARFEETSTEIRKQYETALERQRMELENRLSAALNSLGSNFKSLTPESLNRLGNEGLNNLVTQALHQAEVSAGTRAGVPAAVRVGDPRVTTVTDRGSSSSSSAHMSHDSNLF